MREFSRWINYFFAIFMGYVLLSKGVYLFDILPFFAAISGIVLMVVLIFTVYANWSYLRGLYEEYEKRYLKDISYIKMLLIVFFCSAVSKTLLTGILQIASIGSHPDIQVYVNTAKELVNDGFASTYAGYCFTYSHMFWFAGFLTPAVRIFGDSQLALSLYMALVSSISLLLLFDLIAFTVSKEKAFITAIVLCFLPSQLLVNQYITHEHALLFFLTAALWIFFRILPVCKRPVSKAFWTVFFILDLFFAYLVNTAGLIMIISFCILFFSEAFRLQTRRSFLKGLAADAFIILVIVIGTRLCTDYQLHKSILKENYVKEDKILWTLFVGANAETKAQWSQEDVDRFRAYFEEGSVEAVQSFQKEMLLDRYHDLLRHPGTALKLIRDKSVTIWSCFTYPISYTNETVKDLKLQTIYNKLYRPLLLLEYGASLLASIWCFVSNIKLLRQYTYDRRYFITELYLMGMTALLLLTECSNKYTLAIQPFFWMACIAWAPVSKDKKNSNNLLKKQIVGGI